MTDTKKKVVFLLSGYGVVNRGAERFLSQLRQRLAPDFDVVILGRGPDGEGTVHVSAVSRDNRFFNFLHRLPVIGHAMRFLHLGPLNIEWMTSCLGALPWLMRNRFDLLVPEGGIGGGWLGRFVRARKGIPFVDIAHGAAGRWELAAARCRPDRYVAMTQTALAAAKEHVPDLAAEVIPMAVDTELFFPAAAPRALDLQKPVFLCVGALEPMKRPQLAMEAVARQGAGSLVLAGDGPLAGELDRLASQRLGAGRYLRLSATPSEMPGVYAAADVVTLPSETESFALVYLEAMACNRSMVTQDDAVRREIVGDAGFTCECSRLDEYADALRRAAATDWSDRPRRRAVEFGWDRIAGAYRDLFHRLILPGTEIRG